MSSVIVNKSNATIAVGSNANYTISGDDDIIQVGANSLVWASGLALTVEVAGPGDTITIGGDGQFAPNGCDDVVLFQAGGTLNVLANSRVDANATSVTATLTGDDNFGIYGANDTVIANGTGDGVWIGQNGTGAAGVDVVTGLTQGAVYELQGSNVSVSGSQFAATMSGDDVLSVSGSHLNVSATGAGDVLHVTGDIPNYQRVSDINVHIANGGLVVANLVSALDVFGDNVTLRGDNIYSSELVGAGDRAVIGSSYDDFTIGGNGYSGTLDVVTSAYSALSERIDVLANSNVKAIVNGVKVFAGGGDRVVVLGHQDFLSDTTGGNTFILDGQNNVNAINLFDTATLLPGDIVRMRANTRLGANVNATAPNAATIVMGADDYLSVGDDIKVRVPVAVGAATLQFGPLDTVVLLAHFANAADLLAHTTDSGTGSIIQFDTTGDQLAINVSKSQVASYITQGVIKFA